LFHQTDEASLKLIQKGAEMKCGSQGIVGGGIYFAESRNATQLKAHAKGWVIEARVALGRQLVVQHRLASLTGSEVAARGYDSVRVDGRKSGVEYVIYDWKKASLLSVYPA
jgi:hypothetical protein